MPDVKVKICGITDYEDASAAVEMGADMLGFNFYPESPRYVTPQQAAGIIDRLPAFVDVVGVFVNAPVSDIQETINTCQINWIQLHGDEKPEFCRSLFTLDARTIKAIRVKTRQDIKEAEDFSTDAILLDAFEPAQYGGTGRSFDWNILADMNENIFLAGGINPQNAERAVKTGVYGIDICSGIESQPGKKDHNKMKQLFDNIRYLRG